MISESVNSPNSLGLDQQQGNENNNESEQQSSKPPSITEYEDGSEESDSDIEFIIYPEAGQRVEPPQKFGPYSRVTNVNSSVANSASESAGSEITSSSDPSQTVQRKGINLDAIGEWEGQPITEVSFDNFEDKPWRKPGADITDYFNYGFDELTWAAYCSRQDNLSSFNSQKVMKILGQNSQFSMQMMGSNMMPGGFNNVGFPPAPTAFPTGGFDMMGMDMFPGMPGFPMGNMGAPNVNNPGMNPSVNNDDGAYGGNVQGVAGLVANPHPQGMAFRKNDDQNNFNNFAGNVWNNPNNR